MEFDRGKNPRGGKLIDLSVVDMVHWERIYLYQEVEVVGQEMESSHDNMNQLDTQQSYTPQNILTHELNLKIRVFIFLFPRSWYPVLVMEVK